MGSVIDLEKMDTAYRCNEVKKGIIYINLIGSPISFILLLIGIFRMIFSNKRISFLTSLIILIFSSEIVNTISKMIQIIKYKYPDTREDKNYDINCPRSIICQIQIVLAIFSDYCSLLATLLLSLRCYDVIKNKIRIFDKKKNKIVSITLIISLSIILAIIFLFYDRNINNLSYRYDVRDRCSYWCWLDHMPSLICYVVYFVILFFNIFFACKTNCYLTKGYKKLLEENDIYNEENKTNPLNENSKKKYNQYSNLTKEEIKRIEELKLMRIKCLIYPIITIIIWIFAITYRILDKAILGDFDSGENAEALNEEEKIYFEKNPKIKDLVQFFIVLHTIISATRGIFYGISFIVFEEKAIFNVCRRMCIQKINTNEIDPKSIVSDSSRISDKNETKYLEDNEEEKDDMEENNENENIEMNMNKENNED